MLSHHVENTPYITLSTKDIGKAFHRDFSNTYILTLEQLLDFFVSKDVFLNLEMKTGEEAQDLPLVHKTVEALNNRLYNVKNFLLSSFSIVNLQEARKLGYLGHMGGLMHKWNPQKVEALRELNLTSLNINKDLAVPEYLPILRSLEIPILCYTVNDIEEANRLFDLGIAGIFTDFPEKFIINKTPFKINIDNSNLNH